MDISDRVIMAWVYWAMIGDTVRAVSVRVSGYLVIAATLFYAIGKIDTWLGRSDAETTARSADLVKMHTVNVRWRAKLQAAERRVQASAAAAHGEANALRLSLAGVPAAEQRPILVKIASADSSAYMKCSVALLSCQERASLAEMEARTLTVQLNEQMKVKDHRCGLFVGYGAAAYNSPNATLRFAWELGAGCRILRFPLLP